MANSQKAGKIKAYGGVFYHKARAIKSGETPQKSLILPPVHTFIKGLVTPVNLMFSYFCRISGGVKTELSVIFDKTCKKLIKIIKNNKNYKKLTKNYEKLQKL